MTRRLRTRSRSVAAASARALAVPSALAAITVAAGALRLISLQRVPLDPFYDAAVRSMSLSWHNFFFGAFDPGASTAIDKPPADLWLQVISVKLFGFGRVALKLPEALAGTAAVPVLYDALRRSFGQLAGLNAALVLALLPISVLTGRSDTMDSVMMLLTLVALWLLIRHHETGRARWLYLAAAAVGVAFNVKLFESFVALPALGLLALLAVLGSSAPLRARLLRLALASAVLIAVSLAWLLATLAAPAHDRPFAIGSTNGSAWNAAFVFNGVKRIGSASNEFNPAPTRTAVERPRNNSELARAQVPISSPRALRLFDHDGPLSGLRLGYVLLAALILGLPALGAAAIGPRRRERASDDRVSRHRESASDDRVSRHRERASDAQRVTRAVAATLIVWLLIGVALFSAMTHLHPRYTEAFTPAVAAAAGVGLAWIARAGRVALAGAAATAIALIAYGHHLLGSTGVWALTTCAAALAIAIAALALRRAAVAPIAVPALLVATLALPLATDASIISHHEADSGRTGAMRPAVVRALRSYLRANRNGAHFELAVTESTQASELIALDAQPVLILTSLAGHELVPAAALQREIAAGAVRYAYVGGGCGPHQSRKLAVCTPIAGWIRAHATDVSRAAGLPRPLVLWRLQTR
jgi:4-amino-4-deoxy-L-arabinose transferase-like glycosyltransferase